VSPDQEQPDPSARLPAWSYAPLVKLLAQCPCLAVAVVALSACGGSRTAPQTTKAPTSAIATTDTATQSGVRSSPTAANGCEQAVFAFAQAQGIPAPERAALEGLISSLVRYPVVLRCASARVTVVGKRPAGSSAPGEAAYTCLAAATDIQILETIPGVAAPVRHAAQLAGAMINADQRHGSTFCVNP
jgi:hypothetical protein